MKAIVQDTYGSPDVLELRDVDTTAIGDDDVLIQVRAAGVDPGVWHLMMGVPYVIRLGLGLRKPRVPIRGLDVAGRVEAVGRKVTQFQPGDDVFGTCRGSFAEFARARGDRVAHKPANLTFEQAAAVPVSACAALHGLRDKGHVQSGQSVLITGAGGGVGTFGVQLAKAFGAEVTAVCSAAKADLVRSIGADHVIDYTRQDFTDGGHRYDLILDNAGSRSVSDVRRALERHGTLVIVGGEGGGRWFGGTGRPLGAVMMSPFVGHKLRTLYSVERQEDLLFLKDLIEAGKVTPVVDRTYPLIDAPEAIRHVGEGHTGGKVVITV